MIIIIKINKLNYFNNYKNLIIKNKEKQYYIFSNLIKYYKIKKII